MLMGRKVPQGKSASRGRNRTWVLCVIKPTSIRLRHSNMVETVWILVFDSVLEKALCFIYLSFKKGALIFLLVIL